MSAKSATAFRTISEVAGQLDLPQHVLRFWESKFPTVRPLKRAGGRRYYRPEDIELLIRIRKLLYDDGYTIKGVQKLLREAPSTGVTASKEATRQNTPTRSDDNTIGPDMVELRAIVTELETLRDLLSETARTNR